MTLESDVAAISSRSLWARARDRSEASGTAVPWFLDYDGAVLTTAYNATGPTVSTTSPPPLSSKLFQFGSPPYTCGLSVMKGIVGVTASASLAGTYPAMAFNGSSNPNEFWANNGALPATVGVQFGAGFAATGYTLWGRSDVPGQDPKDWTLEGSNNGTSWTVLDTRTGVAAPSGVHYTFSNATSFTYYRLNISAAQSGTYVAVTNVDIDGAPHRTNHGGSSGEFWIVRKASGTGTNQAPAQTGSGPESYVPYSDGKVYYQVGSSARADNIANTVTWNAWHIERYVKDSTGVMALWVKPSGGSWSMVHSSNTGAASWATTLYLGASTYGTTSNDSQAELIHFNASLTASATTAPTSGDALKVDNYLTDTHFAAVASSGVTGTIAGTSPVGVGSLTGSVPPAPITGTVAGTSPAGVGSLTGTAPTTGTIAGTSPSGVGSLNGSTSSTTTGTIAGTSPAGVGSLTGDVPATSVTGTIGGASPAGVGSLTGDTGTTSLEPWTDGAHGEALLFLDVPAGVLEVTYPAAPAPAAIVEVALQRASHRMPVLTGVRNMDYDIVTDVVGVPHVWVDGVDVTYFRDVPTKIGSPRQESPFGWTSATLTFPSIFHWEEAGVGDLAWLRPDAPVEIAIVKPDGSRLHRFTGQLTSDDPGTGRGRTESVWGVEGLLWQAEHAHHPVPARLDPTDVGTLITKELNGTPSRRFSPLVKVDTGIKVRNRGSRSQTRWGYTTENLATAIREDGKQWTIQPTGARSFALALKDTTTVNWTITAGAPGVELDLSKDNHERIDAVYASGVGPDGYAWSNIFFPQLLPYDPPDYPYADPTRNVLLGDTDAGTLTGHAISDWQRRIRDLGYTSLAVDGVMNSADIAAVYWIQRKRGIQVDGFMGPQTWAATWNVGAVGGDLSTVRLPMAWRTEVEPYLYGANGAVIGKNPAYDPSIIRHEVDVDFGAGVTKEQGREMAQRILERGMDPGIAGTIRLSTCPWEGSRWEVNAGDNVLLKGYRGADVLMRVAAVDPDFDSLTVTLTVDSEFRDAMAVMQVLERNRESKADPARRPGNPTRRSRLDQDQATPFEGESPAGRIPRMALFGGLWTVWPVPVSEVGIVSKLRFQTSGPASKFYLAAFGKPVTANQIAAKVPNPGAKTNPWEDAGEAWLESVGWIEGWGEQGSAAGYGLLGSEADGSPVTGELIDEAGFPYVSQVAPWVWVAMWAPVACYIEGRIFPDPVQ